MLLILVWSVGHNIYDVYATLTFPAAFQLGCAIYFDHLAFCSDDDGEFEFPFLPGRAPSNNNSVISQFSLHFIMLLFGGRFRTGLIQLVLKTVSWYPVETGNDY